MPPRYGSRLMPAVVDEIARTDPNLPYATVALSANISDGFKDVTFADIASATNHLAAWIDRTIGRSSEFDTIAYMGIGDLRYVVVFLAAVKCGYKVLLPSPRNSPWMNVSLLEQTKCSHLLYASELAGATKPLLEQKPDLKTHPIQVLEELIHADAQHYPYDKEYESAKWDPILVLHSSGSTGAPRPIQMNHATFAVGDNDRNLPTVPGRVNQNWSLWDFPSKEKFFSPFPAFHLAGFSSMVMLPIYYTNSTLLLGPSSRPPTGHLVNEMMDHFKLKAIFCPPIIAEQLVQEPGGLEKCENLKFLLYAGGPLSQAAGDALSKVTDVCQFYGQTETGPIQALVPRREDWASLEWHPVQEAIMEPALDGTYEMTLRRNPALEGVRSVSCNFPDVELWRTKDLFKPDPTNPNLWRFHGRADDIIVLSNGEKFNPVPSETQIAAHPLLSGALIIGNSRPQAALILEPKEHSLSLEELAEQTWPTVEKANAAAPGHGRITRDMIMMASLSKPFDRSPKGTIVRNLTTQKYAEEIEELYTRDVSRNLQHIQLETSPDLASITEFVAKVVAAAYPNHSVGKDDDLFGLGLDSLQTNEIIHLLKSGIQAEKSSKQLAWISPKLIYENASVDALAHAIDNHLHSTNNGADDVNGFAADNRKLRLDNLVGKYVKQLPVSPSSGLHVLLTGSTGSLGTQMLVKLLSDPKVSRISCLDRSEIAKERILKSLSSWNPPPELDFSRVDFHKANYDKSDFGLAPEIFDALKKTVHLIIHNAWKVDFTHPVTAFEAVHIRGVHNLVDMCASSRMNPRIVFISSISAVGDAYLTDPCAKKAGSVVIPEELASSPTAAPHIGYAESKAVAEHILAAAASKSGTKATIIRVGQITSPSVEANGGRWTDTEWFPILLKTSKALGKVPGESGLECLNWIPVDVVASTVQDLVHHDMVDDQNLQIYHIVNPVVRQWSEVLPVVKPYLGSVNEVGIYEWVEELEAIDLSDKDEVAAKPAVKILDFFRELRESKFYTRRDIIFSTEKATKASAALRGLGPVREEWVARWMAEWKF